MSEIRGERVLNVSAQRTLNEDGRYNVVVSWLGVVPGYPLLEKFNIYQSLGGKDFTKIGESQIDSYEATNIEILAGVDYFHKVTFSYKETSTGPIIESDLEKSTKVSVYSWDRDGMNIYDHLGRSQHLKDRWLLQKWGENAVIYVRKFAGERCDECWDEEAEIPTKSNCPACFNTGYKDGYLKFNKKLSIEAADERIGQHNWGQEVTFAPKILMDNFPIIHSQDIVVREDNRRYLLTNVSPIRLRNMLIQQTSMLLEAQPDHVAYLLP
jgi:hypothetical protein